MKEIVWIGCWDYNGLKINRSLRSIQLKYFILSYLISVHLISLQFVQFYFIFISISISISFQFSFNFLLFYFALFFSLYFTLYFFPVVHFILFYLVWFCYIYFTITYWLANRNTWRQLLRSQTSICKIRKLGTTNIPNIFNINLWYTIYLLFQLKVLFMYFYIYSHSQTNNWNKYPGRREAAKEKVRTLMFTLKIAAIIFSL